MGRMNQSVEHGANYAQLAFKRKSVQRIDVKFSKQIIRTHLLFDASTRTI
jgi:hypothetical protein